MGKKLSELVEAISFSDGDIVHLRTTGGIDKKMQFVNLIDLFPFGIHPITWGYNNRTNLTLSGGTVTQRIIYCRDLIVTANTTLIARSVFIEGNLTISPGVTLTIGRFTDGYGGLKSKVLQSDIHIFDWSNGPCGEGGTQADDSDGGGGSFGGSCGRSSGGGGSIGANGGNGTTYAGLGLKWNIGGAGGNGSLTIQSGGGGAGPCAGGGSSLIATSTGGDGGNLIFFIVKGNFVNNGTIISDGEIGSGAVQAGGGGGGGAVIIIAFGSSYTGGTINARGGNGGNGSAQDGGGGGGGHIEIYARTASFGTLNVNGGSGPGAATDGGTGTTLTTNMNANYNSLLGGKGTSQTAGLFFQWLEKGA